MPLNKEIKPNLTWIKERINKLTNKNKRDSVYMSFDWDGGGRQPIFNPLDERAFLRRVR